MDNGLTLGLEVALAMLGNICEIQFELAKEADRQDLMDRVRDTLNMASEVLDQFNAG